MDDSSGVKVLESPGHVEADLQLLLQRQCRHLLEHDVERSSLAELHHDVDLMVRAR